MEAATLMLIGSGIQAGGKISGGLAAQDAGEFNARNFERQSVAERAAAQRLAMERRREAELVISRQIALAAASGAGAGPSLDDLIGDTAARGEYQAQGETYGGEARARNLLDRAAISRFEGRNAFVGSVLEGIGNIALGTGRAGRLRLTGASTGGGRGSYFYG